MKIGLKELSLLLICALFCAASSDVGRLRAQEASSRLVAIGDIHGDVEGFSSILQRAGLIDPSRRWIARNTTLVQTGDFTDRGPKVRAVMDLLMDLEGQARRMNSRLLVLLGNHEAMTLIGDLRYVTPDIYAAFSDAKSERRRQDAYQDTLKVAPGTARAEWMAARPVGFVEYQEAFSPGGRYGKWIRSKPVALKVGDTVFLHGGVDPESTASTLEEINRQAANELQLFDSTRQRLLQRKLLAPTATLDETIAAAVRAADTAAQKIKTVDPSTVDLRTAEDVRLFRDFLNLNSWSIVRPTGPLWFRGFSTWTDAEGEAAIPALLKRYDAARFVVGHSIPATRRITPRFDSRVFLIDTGMSKAYVPDGIPSALELANGKATAIYAEK